MTIGDDNQASRDQIGGDKVGGDKVMGDKLIIHPPVLPLCCTSLVRRSATL
jgi:hypothetical protein